VESIVALPISKAAAKVAIERSLERGEFALSPPNVPSSLWREAGREVAREADVSLEFRVDRKTDKCILRLNRGFPGDLHPYSPEAKDWAKNQPGWRADQRVWHDTSHVRC